MVLKVSTYSLSSRRRVILDDLETRLAGIINHDETEKLKRNNRTYQVIYVEDDNELRRGIMLRMCLSTPTARADD